MEDEPIDHEQQIKKKKKSKSNTKIVIILAVILVLLIGFGGGIYLYTHQEEKTMAEQQAKEADPEKTQERYESLKSQVTIDADDPIYRKIDFAAAQAVNPDVYAWIWIPGTNVDYPILQSQTEEDAYYLDHTIERKAGLPGSIYTEKYNKTDFSDPVNLIYGHDMKNGSMFANLHMYEDRAFFDSNPYIYIYLPNNQALKYRIFAAVKFDDRYILGNYNFLEPADFQKYLDELRGSLEGHVNLEVEVTQQKGIITLSTCIADEPNNRWLVNATREE